MRLLLLLAALLPLHSPTAAQYTPGQEEAVSSKLSRKDLIGRFQLRMPRRHRAFDLYLDFREDSSFSLWISEGFEVSDEIKGDWTFEDGVLVGTHQVFGAGYIEDIAIDLKSVNRIGLTSGFPVDVRARSARHFLLERWGEAVFTRDWAD